MNIVYVLIDRVSMFCRVIFTELFRNFNKNRTLEQWIAKDSPSYGSQSKRAKTPSIDLENTYGNYLRANGSYLMERLRFTFTAHGKRQTSVENFSE